MDLLTVLKEICSGSWDVSWDNGDGWGNGNGYGWGGDYSWGNGCGLGGGCGINCGNECGWGDGGWSSGNSNNDGWGITEINGMKIYVIDRIPTAVETVFDAYAKGYTIGNGTALTPCYVAMDGSSLAHGKTLKEAFCDARVKEMKKLPEEKRVKRFVAEHPDPEENLSNEELFYIHHILTGSCEFGRREFCRKNNIVLESSMSISEFLSLTEKEYGGNVIKKIREEYLCRG